MFLTENFKNAKITNETKKILEKDGKHFHILQIFYVTVLDTHSSSRILASHIANFLKTSDGIN